MLRKVEQIILHPFIGQVEKQQALFSSMGKALYTFIQRWGVIYMLLGFLLGRAMIIGELTPFAVPFFAVLYHLRRDRLYVAGFAILLGAFTHQLGHPMTLLGGMALFLIAQRVMEAWGKADMNYTPFAVFFVVFLSKSLVAAFTEWTGYHLMMAGVEATLSLVLTLIFVQSLPLVTVAKRTQPLKNEEIVCLIILLASVMTGTVGWIVMELSLEHILSRYAILIFAFAAGGAIGATVGVVTGIILSLSNIEAMLQMSLLAFSGLLGGLLREGKKIGVAVGLLVGTLLIGFYIGEATIWQTMNESLVAIVLFLFTPKVIFQKISSFIPGTVEHANVQQDYMKRLREVTSHKVEQFSTVFQQLSNSFTMQPTMVEEDQDRTLDLFLSQITEKTCQSCFKKEQCWERKFDDTYRLMKECYNHLHSHGEVKKTFAHGEFSRHCVKSQKVLEVMTQEFDQFKTHLMYKKKMNESRRLVAEQLSGVSQVMTNFAREIQKEGEVHHIQEQQILDAFEDIGLSIRYVDILSLEEGNVQIEISQPVCFGRDECGKIIAPLLSEIVGETITVLQKECDFFQDGYCKMKLVSAKSFKVSTGISSAAKGGGWVSGDNLNTMEVGNGKYAIAISDGMGNGERAHQESNETLTLLQQILHSGIEETVAIKSINSVLALRSSDEIFSTLDLAMIDLQTAKTRFLKIGSTPSFIKRGDECLTITAHNLPIGILHEIDVDVVTEQLKPGDLLIMMTDGLYDAPRKVENKELWMTRMISEIVTKDPQEVADLLLEKVVRYQQGHIVDDMTVVVARIDRNIPQWSTISMQGIPKIKKKPSKIS
ncbi:stage II sporulation protein E [Bacillus horti]|uniref:Stage II sporulation protein E n=1 Tax=Caldalkalibacillus horti TaxID=77523 RepID=A0ABT9W2X8_9BACI|nr:stage II sporulation protein E [Bacillus horti]MDQ0167594.1 stage II sporulation protein E [Bacillus horti]